MSRREDRDDIVVEEAQRNRWRIWLRQNALDDPERDDFGKGGIGGRAEEPGVRFVVLPSDPEQSVVDLDQAFWEWFNRSSATAPAFATQPISWGHYDCPTAVGGARVEKDGRRAGVWRRWLITYRNGGVEFGLQSREREKRQTFYLLSTVGRIWAALDLGRDVIERHGIAGPFLAVLALRHTKGALLTGFGDGWYQDDSMYDTVPCPEKHLLFRFECEAWPDAPAAKALALRFGGWVEDAFGSKSRRFGGPREGRAVDFDAASFE